MTSKSRSDLNGFSNALKIDCTTADTSVAAGEALMIQHRIEGLSCQQIKASSTSTNAYTISFYAKSNASRAIASEITFTNGTNKQISKLHTIGTSWARYTMTVPAASSTQIDNDNSHEADLNFWIHAGSTYTGGTLNDDALDSITNANRAAGIGSIFASTDNTLEITGLQMEVGSQATPFEHRSFGEELALCQRYYYRTQADSTFDFFSNGVAISSTLAYNGLSFPCRMRSAPTLETSGDLRNYRDGGKPITGIAINHTSTYFCVLECTSSGGGLTAGDGNLFGANNDDDASVSFKAEL